MTRKIAPATSGPDTLAPAEVSAEVSTETTQKEHAFDTLGIADKLLEVLTKNKFSTPTPIQYQAIPAGIAGDDLIGIAQTGTGKTLAFGVPIVHRFVLNGNRSRGRALIVLPTRELALQVEEVFQQIGSPFGLKTAILIGGAPLRPQQADLRRNPDVIVATPGRLIDHMQNRNVDLRTVDTLVLDEADRMLDMGFAPQIKQILREVPDERQTMLFSATMPDQIASIAANYMRTPTRIEVATAGTTAERVTQELFIVPQEGKNDLLAKVLYEYQGTILVFARTRSRAARIARVVKNLGHKAAEIHSDRSLSQRRAALDGFKSGLYRILVATDIAARGIDVSGIELVLNYDLPDSADDYVHRIGRTARAGKEGHAISFAAPDQATDVRDIEKLIKAAIEISQHSEHQFDAIAASRRGRASSHGANRGGGARRPQAQPSQRPTPQAPAASAPRNDPARGDFQYSNAGPSAPRRDLQRGRTYRGGKAS